MKLTYVGMDSWDRPVYENEGKLYVDVDPRKGKAPDICTKQGNAFNGEPLASIENGIGIEFIPERITW